ncbi:MAG: GWxTD domain-containing protein, partial [Acidobacteriota bacterium]
MQDPRSTEEPCQSRPAPRRRSIGWLLLLTLVAGLVGPPAEAKKKKTKDADLVALLPEKYQSWLEDVFYIISKDERALFLELEKDYQRDAFIERFWKVRDPYPRTTRNEFRDAYDARLRYAHENLGGVNDDRARIVLTNGAPTQVIEVRCSPYLWPTEVWYYDGSEKIAFEFLLLFYQQFGGGKFRLWQPSDGLEVLSQERGVTARSIEDNCVGEKGRAVSAAIRFMNRQGGQVGAQMLLARIQDKPEAPAKEWVATFSTYSTDLPADAATFEAELAVDFPGRHMSRT